MTRKNMSRPTAAAASQRARAAATQVVPMAKNAVPKAKHVGLAAKHGAEGAMAWAAPRVKDARAWAAPHVEQAGLAVRDKIAPAISDAIVEVAHRLEVDDSAPRRRRWPRVLAGVAMLGAATSALAAVILRRRPADVAFGTQDSATAEGTAGQGSASDGAASASGQAAGGQAEDDDEARANGRVRSS